MPSHTSFPVSDSRTHARLAASFLLALFASACADGITDPTQPAAPPPQLTGVAPAVSSDFYGCRTGTQPSGALWEICVPNPWNGDAIVYAHGYQQPGPTPELPDDSVEGVPVKTIVQGLHYAYVATSYRHKGLVAAEGADDLDELPDIVRNQTGADPGHLLLAGVSEGSLSSILTLQRPGTPFDGALALCGPIGSFRLQVNWFGDFRAVFDYFFPQLLPGDATGVDDAARAAWDPTYINAIAAAMAASPSKTAQLLKVTRAPFDPTDPTTAVQTAVSILWYNFFAAADAVTRLGGNPYDNSHKWYSGSNHDLALNLGIRRYHASATALANLAPFETSGVLQRATVAAHTSLDPVVPAWQLRLFQFKALLAGSSLRLSAFTVDRYGHCSFTQNEVLTGFAVLVLRVTLHDLLVSSSLFSSSAQAQAFLAQARSQGASPGVVPDQELVSAMLRR